MTRLELSPAPKLTTPTFLHFTGLLWTDYCSRHTVDCAFQWWACIDMQIFYLHPRLCLLRLIGSDNLCSMVCSFLLLKFKVVCSVCFLWHLWFSVLVPQTYMTISGGAISCLTSRCPSTPVIQVSLLLSTGRQTGTCGSGLTMQ